MANNNNKKKWTSEMIIKFLEAYESFPCLWDVHSESYENRDQRQNAYESLSNIMGIEGFEVTDVKAKIRSIRNAYTLEISKIKKSKHTGTGADEVYKPKVSWFSTADRILHQVIQIRQTQSSGINTETLSQAVDSADNTMIDEVFSSVPNNSSVDNNKKETPRILTPKPTPPKRATKRKKKSSTDKAVEELQAIAEKLEKQNSEEEENEFDCFGKSVACQLKKLPESVALQSMASIQSYLVKQRLTSKVETRTHSCAASSASSSSCEFIVSPNKSPYCYNNIEENSEQQSTIITQAFNISMYDEIIG